MAIAASNTTCPAAALVAEIAGHAETLHFLQTEHGEAARASVAPGGPSVEIMQKQLHHMIDAAEMRIETVEAESLSGAAFQMLRLKEMFFRSCGEMRTGAPAVKTEEMCARFDLVFDSVLKCLAKHGGSLPAIIAENHELGEESSSRSVIKMIVAAMPPAAAA